MSEAPFTDLPGQVQDAMAFLADHAVEVARLVAFPGVEEVVLDFGVARRDVAVQTDRLPTELIRAAGRLGLGVDLSSYPTEEASAQPA